MRPALLTRSDQHLFLELWILLSFFVILVPHEVIEVVRAFNHDVDQVTLKMAVDRNRM